MRYRFVFPLTAFAMTVGAAAPATAQTPNDVQCLMISNVFAKAAKEAKGRAFAEMAKYFYLGRIHGRFNAAQLKTAMTTEAKAAKIAPESMMACAKPVQDAAKLATAASQQMAPKKK